MRLALVHVRLASRARESLCAVAGEGAGRVDADAVVLARGTCNRRDKEGDETREDICRYVVPDTRPYI